MIRLWYQLRYAIARWQFKCFVARQQRRLEYFKHGSFGGFI
jgi:hypothetical protein